MEQNKDQSDAAVRGEAVAEFNINDTMIVTLTEFGAKIWNDRWNDIPVPGHLIPNPVSAGHVLKDQMWDLMKTFGPHIYLGGDMPFLNAMMAHEKVSARAADAPSEPSELQWRAQFWKLALALNCFPSQFIDANEHVFEEVESLKSRAADALDSQPTVPAADVRERVRDAVADNLRGLYYCGRVWSAWSVGTMGEDDFSPADKDDDIIANITDAVMATLAPVSSQSTDGGVRNG